MMRSRNVKGGRHIYVAGDLSAEEFSELVLATLTLLRPVIDQVWIDAVSDRPWPAEAQAALALVTRLGHARQGKASRTGMGIDLDLSDVAQFDALVALAPYTIHAEAHSGRHWVWSVNDSGDGLSVALTDEEFAQVGSSRLSAK
jgi:hypothetical protein